MDLSDTFGAECDGRLLKIMWTSTSLPEPVKKLTSSQDWIPNHFVPLVSVSEGDKVNFGSGLYAVDEWHLDSQCNITDLLKMVSQYNEFKVSVQKVLSKFDSDYRNTIASTCIDSEISDNGIVEDHDRTRIEDGNKTFDVDHNFDLSESLSVDANDVAGLESEIGELRVADDYFLIDSKISASDSNVEQFPTRFLSPKETINIAINEQNPLKEIPHGEKSKQAYVIDKRHMPNDARGTVFYDDCGHYGKSDGHTSHLLKPTLVNIF